MEVVYPIGSYYISNSSTSPGSLFGGTWSQLTSRFLYPTTNTNTGGGGSHTHPLSGNGGACIDSVQSGTWLNIGKKVQAIDSKSFTPTFKEANNTYESSASTETTWHAVDLMGRTDDAVASLPAYKGVYCWYRTA